MENLQVPMENLQVPMENLQVPMENLQVPMENLQVHKPIPEVRRQFYFRSPEVSIFGQLQFDFLH